MTRREQAAFAAGIETARQMALTAAISLEVRGDASELRQQAAVAALQGLAEGLKATFIDDTLLADGSDAASPVAKL